MYKALITFAMFVSTTASAIKIYVYLISADRGCFDVFIVVTNSGPDGQEYYQASGTAQIGDCGGVFNPGGVLSDDPSSTESLTALWQQEPAIKQELQAWYRNEIGQ